MRAPIARRCSGVACCTQSETECGVARCWPRELPQSATIAEGAPPAEPPPPPPPPSVGRRGATRLLSGCGGMGGWAEVGSLPSEVEVAWRGAGRPRADLAPGGGAAGGAAPRAESGAGPWVPKPLALSSGPLALSSGVRRCCARVWSRCASRGSRNASRWARLAFRGGSEGSAAVWVLNAEPRSCVEARGRGLSAGLSPP